MEEELIYYEGSQRENREDYKELFKRREELHRQCLQQSLTIQELRARNAELEAELHKTRNTIRDLNETVRVKTNKISDIRHRNAELEALAYPDGPGGDAGLSCRRHREIVSQLEEELQDIKDSYRRVIEERCPTDEVHCTCVPALRAEVARLRKALQKIDILCSDRQKIVMIGIQAFGTVSQIVKAALEASDD